MKSLVVLLSSLILILSIFFFFCFFDVKREIAKHDSMKWAKINNIKDVKINCFYINLDINCLIQTNDKAVNLKCNSNGCQETSTNSTSYVR